MLPWNTHQTDLPMGISQACSRSFLYQNFCNKFIVIIFKVKFLKSVISVFKFYSKIKKLKIIPIILSNFCPYLESILDRWRLKNRIRWRERASEACADKWMNQVFSVIPPSPTDKIIIPPPPPPKLMLSWAVWFKFLFKMKLLQIPVCLL